MSNIKDTINKMVKESVRKELVNHAKQKRIDEAAKDFYDSIELIKELKQKSPEKLPKAVSISKIAEEKLQDFIDDDIAAIVTLDTHCEDGEIIDNNPIYDSLNSAIDSAKKLYMKINIDTEVNDWIVQQVIEAERSLRAACEYFKQQEAHQDAIEDREATIDYIGDGEYVDPELEGEDTDI